MQKILSIKEKIILYITIAVILLSVGLNSIVIPLFNKNKALNKEVNFTKVKLTRYQRLLKQREDIQNRYNELFRRLGGDFSGLDKSANALSNLDNLAKNANIRIIDMRPEVMPKSHASYKEVVIGLKTEGAMEGYLKFLYEIEYPFSLLRIKNFQLNVKPNTQFLEGIFTISQSLISE